jgi:UDP-N-acetylmuramoyl-tripeptide--D-alanyl-D-alanine ligase
VALVNNAQRAHLEGLGTVQDVALAKGEIFAGLAPTASRCSMPTTCSAGIWRELSRERRQVRFGLDHPADVRGSFTPHGLGGDLRLDTLAGELTIASRCPAATTRATPAPPRPRPGRRGHAELP